MNPPSLTIDNMPADIQPHVALVANQIQASAAPQNTRRNGKIARLPKPARDLVNRMLDDGLPARVIIDELGQAGEGLNPQNITNWVQGGYQDYLLNQAQSSSRILNCKLLLPSLLDVLTDCTMGFLQACRGK